MKVKGANLNLTKLKEVLVIIPFGLIAKMETQVKE
jgi:hypothetical protein